MSDIESLKLAIKSHYREIRSTEDLAKFTKNSIQTVRKDFLREENTTLAAFIRRTRIEKAKELLEETRLPCHVICRRVGFNREDVGERAFKRLTGRTMIEYRRSSGIDPRPD